MNFTNIKDINNLITDFVDLKTLEKIDINKNMKILKKNNFHIYNKINNLIKTNLMYLDKNKIEFILYNIIKYNLLDNKCFKSYFNLYSDRNEIKLFFSLINFSNESNIKNDLFIFLYENLLLIFIEKNIILNGIDKLIIESINKIFINLEFFNEEKKYFKVIKMSINLIKLLNKKTNKDKLLNDIRNY